MSDDNTTLKLKVEGVVQNVGFREFAIIEANARGITGWVRNRSDGTLEIVVSGQTRAVETFIGACMRGPPNARVTDMHMSPAGEPEMSGFAMGFRRRPTI